MLGNSLWWGGEGGSEARCCISTEIIKHRAALSIPGPLSAFPRCLWPMDTSVIFMRSLSAPERNNGCRSPIRRLQSNVSFAVVLLVHSGDLAALCLRVHRQRDIMESINSGYFGANQFPAHRARGRGFMILPKAPKG